MQETIDARPETAPNSLISTLVLLSLKQAAAVAGMTAAADATETRDPSRNARRNIVEMAPQAPKADWCQLAACKTLAPQNAYASNKKKEFRRELHLTKTHQSQMGGRWAAQRVGSEGERARRGEHRDGETHAWIVARSASGTSARAAGASLKL